MILADTHLLGRIKGHWLDKLKREWQMRRSFQTAVSWLNPEAVFFLGDIFDEGQWATDDDFKVYSMRFEELFAVPENVERFVVVGNHDVGFHYALIPPFLERFSRTFNRDEAVDHVEFKGNHFILINSMAMERDGCRLCHSAEEAIKKLKKRFDCALNRSCESGFKSNYSRPVVMQHFPLYRENDEICEPSEDLAPDDIRKEKFREKWECLSKESTDFLVESLHPRAVFGGHSHFSCSRFWEAPYNLYEYTIASFSWRNNRWPSFLLLTISPEEMAVSKCMIPHEHTTYTIYLLAALCSIGISIYLYFSKKRNQERKLISDRCSPRRESLLSKVD